MNTILVINAGSSSIKFEIFEVIKSRVPQRRLKGQVDGIGTRPRLHAYARDGAPLIEASYEPDAIADVPAGMAAAGDWLRKTQQFDLIAVGHRVVHGGPQYDRPIIVDHPSCHAWSATIRWRRCISRTTWHQSACCWRAVPTWPRSPALILHFIALTAPSPNISPYRSAFSTREFAATDSTGSPTSSSRPACAISPRKLPSAALSWLIWAAAPRCVRWPVAGASKAQWDLLRWMDCRWARGPDRSTLACCSIFSVKKI